MSALRGGKAAAAGLSWLPADLAEFVGREREIEQLAALVKSGAVAVIAGMPGSGKTALAAHLARSMPGFASADVAFATAADLHRHRLEHYRSASLLIADGLSRSEIETLLANRDRPPHVVITTRDLSYEPEGAALSRLGPLSDDEAARLLGFLAGPQRVGREESAAAEIVRLCGGLPLALQVAGKQLAGQPLTGLGEFAEQIRRHRWRDESRQGVVSVLDDARAALPDNARRAFPLLAVAGETFPATKWDAIVQVLAEPGPAALAGALAQAGLLEPQGNGAWRANPLVVSFAQAQLSRDAALRTAAAAAMIRWHASTETVTLEEVPALLRAVQVAGAWVSQPALDDLTAVTDSLLNLLWEKRLWPQWEQLHRAVRLAAENLLEPALQTKAAANLVIGYLAQHRLTEASAELRAAATSRPHDYPPEAGARLWLHEVSLRWLQGDLDSAERLATRALAEANQVEDPSMVLLVRMAWAHLERDRGNVAAAVTQWTDIAFDSAREAVPEVQTLALIRAAKGSVELGAVDRARDLLEQAVTGSAGIVPHEAITLAEQARLEQANGHADRAYASARRAATLHSGAPEVPENGPKWIWWPRPLLYCVPIAAAGLGSWLGIAMKTVAPFILGAVVAFLAVLLLRWAHETRKRLTLNVWRAIQRRLDSPELAAETVPLSHHHFDRLCGGDP